MRFNILVFLTLFFLTLSSWSAALNTQCEKNDLNGQVTGVNTKVPFTIASVSKVFTTHWALYALGPHYRYIHKIHITPAATDIYDVHIEGDSFPYFDRVMFQFLIAELNRLNITQINYLTYDENFEYTSVVQTLRPSGQKLITQELRKDTNSINTNLINLGAKVFALDNIRLPRELKIAIKDIHPLSKAQFKKTSTTRTYTMASSELSRTLKEMNRNSNNFTADKVFEKLSVRQKYTDFLFSRVHVPKEEVIFYNGSGYPIVTHSGKVYNKASCNAVVEVISDLKNGLAQMGMGLQDVMAVAGQDSAADGDSTITEHYGTELTSGALIAKTGTVGDTLSLAGLIMLPNQNIFFHTSYKYNASAQDKESSYTRIRNWVESILKANKAGHPLQDYHPKAFLPFDQGSFLQEETAPLLGQLN